MIVFGGYIFWILILLLVGLEIYAIRETAVGFSVFVLLVCIAVFYFAGYKGGPDFNFNFKLLFLYPVLSIMWLPIYWYLDLYRTSRIIRSEIRNGNSIEEINRKYSNDYNIYVSTNGGKVNIKHPSNSELILNAAWWPLSILSVAFRDILNIVIDTVRSIMDTQASILSARINSILNR